jgi:hypothetical protein
MPKYYYLSRFIGSGTERDPFRPLAARFGHFSVLDLRPDETRPEGWCFACVEIEGHISAEPESGLIYLGQDPHAELNTTTISRIKDSLRVDFKSRTLAEIAAEILLFQRLPGLTQGVDGKYRLYLCGLLWEATEAEAYDFVGRLREDELLGPPSRNLSKRVTDLREALADALTTVAHTVDHGRSGWLDKEIEKVRKGRSNHPLATRYVEANAVVEESDLYAYSCLVGRYLDADARTRSSRHYPAH